MKLILFDPEHEYVERVNSAIAAYFALQVQLKAFTAQDDLQAELKSPSLSPCFLLYCEGLVNEQAVQHHPNILKRFILTENPQGINEQSIFKYQSVKKLVQYLFLQWQEAADHDSKGLMPQNSLKSKFQYEPQSKPQSKLIAFYASKPGSGKTTLALHTAYQLAKLNIKALYLNLEFRNSTAHLLAPENLLEDYSLHASQHVSHLYYYAQHNQAKLEQAIQTAILIHPETQINYLNLPSNGFEMQACKAETVQVLLKQLQELEEYDYILLDLSSDYHERTLAALEMSEQIIWVCDAQDSRLKMVKQQLSELEATGYSYERKAHFIFNKVVQAQSDVKVESMDPGIQSIKLPYIAEWKFGQTLINQLQHPLYSAYVQEWLKNWLQGGNAMEMSEFNENYA